MKFWKRVQNFLVGGMEDNNDRLYVGSRSVAHLVFSQDIEKSFMYDKYKNALNNLKKVTKIQEEEVKGDTLYEEMVYKNIPLKLSYQRICSSPMPYDIKFMIMILISHNIIDIYTFDDSFLGKICKVNF